MSPPTNWANSQGTFVATAAAGLPAGSSFNIDQGSLEEGTSQNQAGMMMNGDEWCIYLVLRPETINIYTINPPTPPWGRPQTQVA